MLDLLGLYENLSFEIYNTKGEMRVITHENSFELMDPLLSSWLGLDVAPTGP